MDESPPIDDALLDRYVADQCTSAERLRIEAWIGEKPDRLTDVDELRTMRVAFREGAPVFDHRAAIANLRDRMHARPPMVWPLFAHERGAPTPLRRIRWIVPAGLGAVAAAVLVAIAMRTAGVRGLGWREYATGVGQRENVTLADGTQLTLAPASRVRMTPGFGRGARDVYLQGEAYFVVTHDAVRPFAVHVGNAVARDIGTRFAVRAYRDDHAVLVAVAEGEVGVVAGRGAGAARERPVRSGDIALITDTAVAITSGADVAAVTAWTRGELVFTGAPLRDVLAEVARWYDVDVHITSGALGDRPVTASFANEPVDDVLAALAAGFGARETRRGRVVVFSQ
jgi:transmembrane sensor